MRVKIIIFILLIASGSSLLYSQEAKPDSTASSSSFTLTLNQDPFFGFYPYVNGSWQLNESLAFTIYGVYWTQDISAGNLGGLNLLTEAGIGLNISIGDGSFSINPTIGFGNGNYQSGGTRAVVGDNIVPSLNYAYTNGNFSLTGFACAWLHLREEGETTPYLDFLEYSFSPGFDISKRIALGIYYDHYFTKTSSEEKYKTSFLWVGPFVKFKIKESVSILFSAGFDFVEQLNDLPSGQTAKLHDFYKLSTAITL